MIDPIFQRNIRNEAREGDEYAKQVESILDTIIDIEIETATLKDSLGLCMFQFSTNIEKVAKDFRKQLMQTLIDMEGYGVFMDYASTLKPAPPDEDDDDALGDLDDHPF